jgi:hypothetical protein
MKSFNKLEIKEILGTLPFTAEVYWFLRHRGKPFGRKLDLTRIKEAIPIMLSEARDSSLRSLPGKNILIFGTLRLWIEQVVPLSVTLAGLGHRVTLAYLPYDYWQYDTPHFDLRRQNVYAWSVLSKLMPLVNVVSWYNHNESRSLLVEELDQAIRLVSLRDTQYTMQVEEVDEKCDLYHLRLERNIRAAKEALDWMNENHPDAVIIPNGTILEFGAVYQVARFLKIPVMTYEFGEQNERLWLAQNAEVMRQNTDGLWQVWKDRALTESELNQVQGLFMSRQNASLWQNFTRSWQGAPSQGGEKVRTELGLDTRPVVLLATNVIGDSLTLGRQVFSDSMTAWIARTIQFFARREDAQLVIRIHPGELLTKGPSVAGVVKRVFTSKEGVELPIPDHIHLVPADAKINTYDIMEIADMGLVYTTTVGMEMAMSGKPVLVVGNTHYRGKGFTLDPRSWDGYFELLGDVITNLKKYHPTQEQVEQAWNYAYRFFFTYPLQYPWHMKDTWGSLKEWPVARVLSQEGMAKFGRTFASMVGSPIDWESTAQTTGSFSHDGG